MDELSLRTHLNRICEPERNGGTFKIPSDLQKFQRLPTAIDGSISLKEIMQTTLSFAHLKKKFYLIAHRVNSISAVTDALNDGANAIECDIRFNNSKGVFVVNHDVVIFYRRDNLVPYLRNLRRLANVNPHFSLVIFDIKETDPNLAIPLLELIRTELTNHIPLQILISIASYDDDRDFFKPLMDRLRENEGVSIDEDNDPVRVSEFFRSLGFDNHGYGNGIAVPLPGHNITRTIAEGIALKAKDQQIKIVYVWTLADEDSYRNYLRLGVDGIFVNDVAELRSILNEPEFQKRNRLATRNDLAFVPEILVSYILKIKTGNKSGAGTDANITFTLKGAENTLSSKIDTSNPGLFEKGDTNKITLTGIYLGAIKSLKVSHDGSGLGDSWFLARITVQKSGTNESVTFNFNQWIEKNLSVTRNVN